MRFIGLVSVVLLFASPLSAADMTPEERCNVEGDVALEAAEMRLAGDDRAAVTKTLTEQFEAKEADLTGEEIDLIVMMTYMAKMKPEKAKEYAISECRKDIHK